MGKNTAKATKKFAASGQLKKQIQARRKHQQVRKKIQNKKGKPKGISHEDDTEGAQPVGSSDELNEKKQGKMSVDDLLSGAFMDGDDDEEEPEGNPSDSDDEDDGSENDDQSFASLDKLEDEGEAHLIELSALADKDPEFYQYLQENDQELLEFDPSTAMMDEDEDEPDNDDEDMREESRAPLLTAQILQGWQRALLDKFSLRALRKLLIAFRSAVHMNEDDQVLAWTIDSASVYNKLLATALKYTPVILSHHAPIKTLASGKIKAPKQTPKLESLQKLITSYFGNITHLLSQLPDDGGGLLEMALKESAKVIPWVIGSRRAAKLYLKKCLGLWASASDDVRMMAFLAIRSLATASDSSILDLVLKNTYLTLVRASKSPTAHTLPALTLMKNTAATLYTEPAVAAVSYQLAFGYIRQLAILLRGGMKSKTKDAYKQVYNWQYAHSVDFWALVLAQAHEIGRGAGRSDKEGELYPLIYPLVQVSLGAIKLISHARSYPFHLHIIRSLLNLSTHTRTYIPLAPYLLPLLTSSITPSTRSKSTTLRPLDFETIIRAPQQYLKTRIYTEGIVEEAIFVLASWLASPTVGDSIAFPELVVPLTVTLRKALKIAKSSNNSSSKDTALVKTLLERVDDAAKEVDARRQQVSFGPSSVEEVAAWETQAREQAKEGPVGRWVRVLGKSREKRQKLMDKAREGRDEVLED